MPDHATPRSHAARRTQSPVRQAEGPAKVRWRRPPAYSPSSDSSMSRKNCFSSAERRGLNPALNPGTRKGKMDISLCPSSAGPKMRPKPVRVAVHLVEIDRLLERADLRAGLPEADW